MKLSGLIDALVAAGGTLEQVQALIRAAEAEETARQVEVRARSAAKKRRQRLRLSPDVPGTDGDARGQPGTPVPPKEGPPDPLRNNPLTPEKNKKTPAAPSRIAEDWQPDQDGRLFALEEGIAVADLATTIAAFRDHWLRDPDGRQADWAAAWRGWVRNGLGRRKPGAGGAPRAGPLPDEPKVDLPIGRISERLVRETWSAGRWPKSWGPKRGEPGCRVPERVFEVQA